MCVIRDILLLNRGEVVMGTFSVGGKEYNWNSDTKFLVEVGKGSGKYSPRYSFVGNFDQASFYYSCINIGLGYKKRFVMESGGKRTVVSRCLS